MAKTWILDTETKGTGAHMVPLEKALRANTPEPRLNLVELKRPAAPKPAPEAQAPPPRRFKVLDLMSRETLARDADTRTTVELLRGVRSIVDVELYVWNPQRSTWRLLTLGEKRALWRFREPAVHASSAA